MENGIKELGIIFSVKTDTADHRNVSFNHQITWRHMSSYQCFNSGITYLLHGAESFLRS